MSITIYYGNHGDDTLQTMDCYIDMENENASTDSDKN